MNCHFHQNIVYVAFKSSDQMHAVCGLRLYTDDGRLLSGRPRFHSQYEHLQTPLNDSRVPKRKAMSLHTHDLSDIRYQEQPSKCNH